MPRYSAGTGPGESPAPPPFPTKPAEIDMIGLMVLIGGVVATVIGAIHLITDVILLFGLIPCICWPGWIYSFVVGIMCIMQGMKLRGPESAREAPPKLHAWLMIGNIINGDIITMVLGIVVLMSLGKPEVLAYYQGGQPALPASGGPSAGIQT